MSEVEDTKKVETVVVCMEDKDLDHLNLTQLIYMGESEEDG